MTILVEKQMKYTARIIGARKGVMNVQIMSGDDLEELQNELVTRGITRYVIIDNLVDLSKLPTIKPQRMFIDEEGINEIVEMLNLNNLSKNELQVLRNTVVKFFDDINVNNFNPDDYTRMSMVTGVIDNMLYRNGRV